MIVTPNCRRSRQVDRQYAANAQVALPATAKLLPGCCCHSCAFATTRCRHHHLRHAEAKLPPPPRCCQTAHCTAANLPLLPLPGPCRTAAVTTALLPSCCRCCAATKLPLPLPTFSFLLLLSWLSLSLFPLLLPPPILVHC